MKLSISYKHVDAHETVEKQTERPIARLSKLLKSYEPDHESWQQTQITDEQAKLIFYSAFVEGKLDASKGLLPDVHRLYFQPEYPEFAARTMWSLSNAFTSAFKKLDPIPQFKATAKLGEFLSSLPTD